MAAKISGLLFASMLLSLAARAASVEPAEFLDERTGATVTVVHDPFVFALERSSLAANARDYVSLVAVEVDRSGEIALYMIAYAWSTIDRRSLPAAADRNRAPLDLLVDGREYKLVPLDDVPQDLLDDRKLLAPPAARASRAAYKVSVELLHDLSNAREPTLNVDDPYQLWSDGRKALRAFLDRIDAQR